MNKYIPISLGLCLSLFQAQAQELSLNEAVKIALEQNLNIKVAQQDLRIAEKNNNWGNAGFLPNVNANASYTYSQTDVQQQLAVGSDTGGPAPIREFNDAVAENYQAGLSASYVLFDGLGRINNLKRLQLQEELSETQLRFTIENVLLGLFSAYYEAARQREQMDIAKESVQISLKRYQRAQTALELGSQGRLESLSAMVDLRRDSIAYLNTLNAWQKSNRELNRILSFPADTTLKVDSTVTFKEGLIYGQLQGQAMQNNAALIQSRISKDINRKNLNLAWSDRMPEIAANAGYNFSRQENEGGFLRFTENTGWQYGLSAQWNIFSSYRSQTQVEVARIAVFQSELAIEQARQDLKVDLANAWLDYQHAQRILALEERNLAVAQLTFQRSKEAYALGSINNTQYREAQLNFISAKAAVNDLKYRRKLSEIELQRVAGVLMQGLEE